MLQFRHIRAFVSGIATACVLSACASEHFFPRLKPLFAGLEESQVPVSARRSLAEAKVDFQLARQGMNPHYAKAAGTLPCSHSRVFEGNGYQLTLVDKDLAHITLKGPQIVLGSRITQGQSYHYDEIDRLGE